MKITLKQKKDIASDLHTIIDINRVGSDEIDFITDILKSFEKQPLKELTREKLITIREQVKDLQGWSARFSGDERYISNCVVKLIDSIV